MLYLLYGNRRDKLLARSKEIIDGLLKSDPEALFFRIKQEDFTVARLEELAEGQSLFSRKIAVLCEDVASRLVPYSSLEILNRLSASKNLFVFREDKTTKEVLDIFKRGLAKIEEHHIEDGGYAGAREVAVRPGYGGFNIFNFTDALGSRDRKRSWVLYHHALRAGFPAEELFWKAVWLFRGIILVSQLNKGQKELESKLKIKRFTIEKSKKFLEKYEINALKRAYGDLCAIYHDFRRGGLEMELAMEKFILNI